MISPIKTSIRFKVLFLFIFIFASLNFQAHEGDEAETQHSDSALVHEAEGEGKVDITKVAFEHILDSHYWHFWGEGHEAAALPLPCIVYSNTKGLQFFSSSVFEHGHAEYNGYRLVEE